MTDLVINEAYLSEAAEDLRSIREDMDQLCTEVRNEDGLVVGAAPVFDELVEFSQAWSGALDDLAEAAGSAAVYVDEVLLQLSELDLRLAQALTEGELERQGG